MTANRNPMVAGLLTNESGTPICKYMAAGLISHRLCARKGRCKGCPTEEMAIERTPRA